MLKKIGPAAILFSLLVSLQLAYAAPIVRQASFQRIFDGTNHFGEGAHFSITLSTMSSDGRVVAFYGRNSQSPYQDKLFVHDFDSTMAPVEVDLTSHNIGTIFSNTGLLSNADGTRIFFVADDTRDASGNYRYCRVDGTTGAVTVILDATPSNIDVPQDIATDGLGTHLYFNESDNGDRGDLWRIQAAGDATPELVIHAGGVGHPSGGMGRFVDQFDISDDSTVIAFFINGRDDPVDGLIRTNKELFVKTSSGIANLTDNDQNDKGDLRLSGDGSTIVYSGDVGSYDWMVTTPTSGVNGQVHLENGYRNAGDRPGMTTDGSVFFGRSCLNGTSACDGYLVHTDGSARQKMDTYSNTHGVTVSGTAEGVHLSGDGSRVAFKSIGSYGIFNTTVSYMYTGTFNSKPWPSEVPEVTSVAYPAPLFSDLVDTSQRFAIDIGVADGLPDNISGVGITRLFSDGYPDDGGGAPIAIYQASIAENPGFGYTAEGRPGSSWPALDSVTVRLAVKDLDGNVGYTDTVIEAANAACSGTVEVLEVEELTGGQDVSCIADSRVDTLGDVIVNDKQILYLFAPIVNLNGGFSARAGSEVIIR